MSSSSNAAAQEEEESKLRRSSRAPKPVQMSPDAGGRAHVTKNNNRKVPQTQDNDNDDNDITNDYDDKDTTAIQDRGGAFARALHQWVTCVAKRKPELVKWSQDGTGFFVMGHRHNLASYIKMFFAHARYESLRRQFNVYGFEQRESDGAFTHPHFHRDRPITHDFVYDEKGETRFPRVAPTRSSGPRRCKEDNWDERAQKKRRKTAVSDDDEEDESEEEEEEEGEEEEEEEHNGRTSPVTTSHKKARSSVSPSPPRTSALPPAIDDMMFQYSDCTDDSSVESYFPEKDMNSMTLEEVLNYNANKRRFERRNNRDYVAYHRLYSAAVQSTDFPDGLYEGPYADGGSDKRPYGPAFMAIPSKAQRQQQKSENGGLSHHVQLRAAAGRKGVVSSSRPLEKQMPPATDAKARRKDELQQKSTNKPKVQGTKSSQATTTTPRVQNAASGSKDRPRVAPKKKQTKPKKPSKTKALVLANTRVIGTTCMPGSKASSKRPLITKTAKDLDLTDLSQLPRGVTRRPSGRWQAQFYFCGRSRYIGVFNSSREAAYAYRVVHDALADMRYRSMSSAEADQTFTAVRTKAFKEAKDAAQQAVYSAKPKQTVAITIPVEQIITEHNPTTPTQVVATVGKP